MSYKKLSDVIDGEPELAQFAASRGLTGEDRFVDPGPTPISSQQLERIADGWMVRGVDRACALAMLRNEERKTKALGHVRDWQRSGKLWLRMQGGRGVGKTWAACSWLMRGRQADVRLVTGAEVARWADWDKRWEELDTVPRLVVDDPDIPEGRPAAWYRVLEARHRHRLPTIITTNAVTTVDEKGNVIHCAWWSWWGEYRDRLESRFREIGKAVQIGGGDMRAMQVVP